MRLKTITRDGPLPDDFRSGEVVVPPFGSRRVLAALPQMPDLRLVQVKSAGVDWVAPHVPRWAALCNARGARDAPVAEWVLAAILADRKLLPRFLRQQAQSRWEHAVPAELHGSRALIVGYGSIGAAVEARLRPFGVAVGRVARRARPGVEPVGRLPELLPDADIVVLLTPATPATAGLFDERMLAAMRSGALLVNAGRGVVVDTDALCEALAAGRIRAALDVTDPEPLPPDHPLWGLPGVIVTPHAAGDSDEAERRVYRLVGDQIRRLLGGEPLLNVVHGSDERR